MGFGIKVYRVFRPIIDPLFLPFFRDIEPILKKARINKDIAEYLGDTFIYSIIIATFFAIFGIIAGIIVVAVGKNPKLMILLPVFAMIALLVGFTFSILFFRIYPSLIVSSRARKIDNALYLATIYMATIATSGSNPLTMFSLLAKYKEFSEISKEAADIVQYVRGLGMDLATALHIKAANSPSREWKELLEGIRSIIMEGGDLEKFLYDKAHQYIQDFKRKLVEYTNSMQVILEIYITMIIVGVIFVLILTTLLGSIMGGNAKMIQQMQMFLVLVFLPASTIVFILILKAMSPFEV